MVLVHVQTTPEACGKTLEVNGIPGYWIPQSIAPALAPLKTDRKGGLTPAKISATFAIMQQFLPRERQDAAAMAMGQAYKQLDKGETGCLGERGTEDAETAAPKPTNV
jgi:hypothetical protein